MTISRRSILTAAAFAPIAVAAKASAADPHMTMAAELKALDDRLIVVMEAKDEACALMAPDAHRWRVCSNILADVGDIHTPQGESHHTQRVTFWTHGDIDNHFRPYIESWEGVNKRKQKAIRRRAADCHAELDDCEKTYIAEAARTGYGALDAEHLAILETYAATESRMLSTQAVSAAGFLAQLEVVMSYAENSGEWQDGEADQLRINIRRTIEALAAGRSP